MHSQRPKIKQRWVVLGAFIIALIIILAIFAGYGADWTGFGIIKIITISGSTGVAAPPTNTIQVNQLGKTLWDWLQLLIIPFVLAVAGFVFTYTTNKTEREAIENRAQTEREATEKRAQTEREAIEKRAQTEREAIENRAQTERDIAADNQNEAELQSYIDKISELLLEKNLRNSLPAYELRLMAREHELRSIARVRTLTTLHRLDGGRKGIILRFLYD